MPFGEELGAGTGGRTAGMGFSNSGDNNRKKFTGYERDNETGLDFAQARYNSSTLGRFTSPDPFSGSMSPGDPQSFNRYAYVGNNPLTHTDPTGLHGEIAGGGSLPRDESALGRLTGENGVFSTESWKAAPTASSEPEEEAAKDAEGGSDDGKGSDPERGTSAAQQSASSQITPCDQRLAGIFGGMGAVVGSTNDPATIKQIVITWANLGKTPPAGGVPRAAGHGPEPFNNPDPKSSDKGGIIHIYGNAEGTITNTGLYTPAGGSVGKMFTTKSDNTQINVNYARGLYRGLTIAFVHVRNGKGGPNAMRSIRIGTIGGPGGIENPNYVHTHIVFFMNGARVDPRTIFCK